MRAPTSHARIPALDGIRALALAAVLLYHAGAGRAPGGFLGVDVFFVLSGYLITGLLAQEYLREGRIRLSRFYLRRARRLLPALFTVVAAVCLFVVVALPQEAATLRGDAAASAGYVTNWWFVLRGQSYFGGTGRPSLLLHLWSLAVEEQFYLVWPVLFVLMLGRRDPVQPAERVRALWRAVGWATVLAAVSVGLTAYYYSPWADPSRVYYGTDTRAFELLTGVVLALATTARRAELAQAAHAARPAWRRNAGRIALDASSFAALVALVLAVMTVPSSSTRLYPFGLLAVSLAAAVLIHTSATGSALVTVLARRPMVWLGERSYAAYLWHWPLFDVTRPGVDVHWPTAVVVAVRFGGTLLLAEATYRWIEDPVRGGALGRAAARGRASLRARSYGFPASAATGTLAAGMAAVWLVTSLNASAARHPVNPEAIAVDAGPATSLVAAGGGSGATGTGPGGASGTTGPGSARSAGSAGSAAKAPAGAGAPSGRTLPSALPPPPADPPRVALVGDSQGMTLFLNRPPDTARYLTLFDDTTEGCGFLGGRVTSEDGERRDLGAACSTAPDTWARRVSRDRAATAVVMIGAWDVFTEDVDGVTMPFGGTAWDQYFSARLDVAVGKLKAAGASRVMLALVPCYRPVKESGSGFWPERGDDSRTRHINSLLTAYAANPENGASTLQPPAAFCQDPTIASSRAYRWDGVHYYKPGALLYFETAIPQLLTGAR